jgi:hypothetical protein
LEERFPQVAEAEPELVALSTPPVIYPKVPK